MPFFKVQIKHFDLRKFSMSFYTNVIVMTRYFYLLGKIFIAILNFR